MMQALSFPYNQMASSNHAASFLVLIECVYFHYISPICGTN